MSMTLYYNPETKVIFASDAPQADGIRTITKEETVDLQAHDGATVDASADDLIYAPAVPQGTAAPIQGTASTQANPIVQGVSTPENTAPNPDGQAPANTLPAAPDTASTDPKDDGAVTTTGVTNARPDSDVTAADAASASDVAAGDKISGATTPETNPSGVKGADVRTEIDGDKPSPATGVVKATGFAGETVPADAADPDAVENKDEPEGWVAKIIRIAEHEGGDAMAKIRTLAHKIRESL